ncbi:MAG: ABC transporter ATP-binding protein [Velocimicrobium sp.]
MVKIKEVSFEYAGNKNGGGKLEEINFSVKKGECILLCGRSGCGKTTITRLLNGLIPAYFSGDIHGEVTINDKPIDQLKMYEISEKAGSVFQNPKTQFFNVDTDSEIAFALENRALPTEQIQKRLYEVYKELGLEKLKGRSIFELSGGEKQKIAFASVYAMNPEIYLLDEPSSNLDMNTIRELKSFLMKIKEQGKTIIIAEHRIHYLMDVADRVLYIADGKIHSKISIEEFQKQTEPERMNYGIRALDLNKVHPEKLEHVKQKKIGLEVKDVCLFHKKDTLLQEITFQATQGEIIAITGQNGSGKTTFLRTLCGLHKKYTGTFLLDGRVQTEKIRLKESYLVMQDVNYELFADTVSAECTMGIKKPDLALIERTLKALELYNLLERHPNTLSGGQKQRLAVAVSIVRKKKILAFDEPTSGLDYDNMKRVAELIKKLAENSIVFIVTHDYELICQACSRVIHFGENTVAADLPVTKENENYIKQAIGLME